MVPVRRWTRSGRTERAARRLPTGRARKSRRLPGRRHCHPHVPPRPGRPAGSGRWSRGQPSAGVPHSPQNFVLPSVAPQFLQNFPAGAAASGLPQCWQNLPSPDRLTRELTTGGTTQAGHGLIGQELWTNTHGATPDSSATWDPLLTANSCYAISAFIPDNYANGTATDTIHAAVGTHPAVVNQEAYTNAWAPLGTFKTDITGYVGVTLTDQSPVGFYLAADAVMFAPTSCQDAGGSSLIIDPASPSSQFALGGSPYPGTVNGWYSRPGHGLNGHEVWTNSN